MFQLPKRLYDPGFPGSHMRGPALLNSCWDRDPEKFKMCLEKFVAKHEASIEKEGKKSEKYFLKDIVDENGNNCLHVAAYRSCLRIIELLLETKNEGILQIDVNSTNMKGITPLHFACYADDVQVISKLLKEGADPQSLDFNGRSPIHIAAESNSLVVLDLFLNTFKFHPDVCAYSGATPLVVACQEMHKRAAKILARGGADICKKSTLHDGLQYVTPYLLAQQQGWGEELRSAGAVPETPEPPYLVEKTDEQARFRWHAPAGRSAPVEYYKLQIRKIDRLKPDEKWKTVAEKVKERVHVFYICRANCSSFARDASSEDLEPSEVYEVRVFAWSLVGWSKPSLSSKILVTSPAAPCTPDPPEILNAESTSVRLRWVLPENNGVRIDRSELQWALCHTPYTEWSTVPDKELQLPEVNSDEEESSSESDTDEDDHPLKHLQVCEYTVRYLAPKHYYKFRVRVHNIVGWSYLSKPSKKAFTDHAEIISGQLNSKNAVVRVKSSRRQNAFRFSENKEKVNSFSNMYGTALHARARFLSMQRARLDQRFKSELDQEALEQFHRGRVEKRAATRIQTFLRCNWTRRKYNIFRHEWTHNRYFLIEYGTEAQFLEKWRHKLLRAKLNFMTKQQIEQNMRDAKRRRKMERRLRREKRQLKRVQRKALQSHK